ncbi:hypothetical protein PINS_up008839 [Pythium insidiosum]|nr:hypothetical protein PINS_up008839 [Pythium insidiosum]
MFSSTGYAPMSVRLVQRALGLPFQLKNTGNNSSSSSASSVSTAIGESTGSSHPLEPRARVLCWWRDSCRARGVPTAQPAAAHVPLYDRDDVDREWQSPAALHRRATTLKSELERERETETEA